MTVADHLTTKAQALAAGWTIDPLTGSWQRRKPGDPKVLEIVSAEAYPFGPPDEEQTRERSRSPRHVPTRHVAQRTAPRVPFTVHLVGRTLAQMEEEIADSFFRFSERVETGGYLYSLGRAGLDSVTVFHASGPGSASSHARTRMQLSDPYVVERESPFLSSRPDLVRVGEWHIHPGHDATPSRADRSAWESELRKDTPTWVGLILTPGGEGLGWMVPQVRAWVTRRIGDTNVVCDPARVVD